MTSESKDNKVSELADILAAALSTATTKGIGEGSEQSVIKIKLEQFSELIPDTTIDRHFMMALAHEMSARSIYLTSIMEPNGKDEFKYYLAYKDNNFYHKAVAMPTSSLKKILDAASISLDTILSLNILGLSDKMLSSTTCGSIGHSSIVYKSEKDKLRSRCVRCGAIVTKGLLQQATGKPDSIRTIGWRDVVHVSKDMLKLIASSVTKVCNIDPYALELLTNLPREEEVKKVKAKKSGKSDKKNADKPKKQGKSKPDKVKKERTK